MREQEIKMVRISKEVWSVCSRKSILHEIIIIIIFFFLKILFWCFCVFIVLDVLVEQVAKYKEQFVQAVQQVC